MTFFHDTSSCQQSTIRLDRCWYTGCAVAALLAVSLVSLSSPASAETISDALASAYKSNPRLDAARATLRATDEDVARAHSGYRPTVTGTADITYNNNNVHPSGASNNRDNTSRGYSINATQPLFRGFRVVNQVKEAEALVRAGRETLRTTEQVVLLDAVTFYLDVVRDTAIVRLRENNVEVLSRELKATRDRFTVGEVTRTDVAQAEARRAASVSALDLARSNLKTSRGNFERAVGRPPSNLVEPKPNDKRLPRSLEESIAISAREHPSVIGALYREQAARHTVDRIAGELLPSAQLEAVYAQRNHPSPGQESSESTTVRGVVTVPFYEAGDVRARVRQSKHTHVARLQEIEQNRTEVQATVVQAWSSLSAARAQVVSDQAQVDATRTALQGVREEEKVGQRTLLDVLNAEQEALNAEVNLVTTKRNLVVASYALLSSTGRLNIQELGVTNSVYDAEVHYFEVRRKWYGISITHADGRHERHDFWAGHGGGTPAVAHAPAPSKAAKPTK
jgi:outer membrane protein